MASIKINITDAITELLQVCNQKDIYKKNAEQKATPGEGVKLEFIISAQPADNSELQSQLFNSTDLKGGSIKGIGSGSGSEAEAEAEAEAGIVCKKCIKCRSNSIEKIDLQKEEKLKLEEYKRIEEKTINKYKEEQKENRPEETFFLGTDSREYDILVEAVNKVTGVEGLTCEIGVRAGGSSKIIIDTLHASDQKNRTHVAIDPYGDILYTHHEQIVQHLDYTNDMKRSTFKNLYAYAEKMKQDIFFMPMEDTEFFNRFSDGIPTYSREKRLLNSYAFVFFDGPHSVAHVKTEFDFFKTRTPVGSVLVFDDIDQYPHMDKLDEYICSFGFDKFKKGHVKIAYIRSALKE